MTKRQRNEYIKALYIKALEQTLSTVRYMLSFVAFVLILKVYVALDTANLVWYYEILVWAFIWLGINYTIDINRLFVRCPK